MNRALILLVLVIPFAVFAQETITLEQCIDLVSENYPLAKQSVLLDEQSRLDIKAINQGKLPKLDLNAQATYQSEVPSFPLQLPDVTVEEPNNDQYRASLDVNQVIYNGGLTSAFIKATEIKSKVDLQEVEVNLYALKNQVNHLYLSVLLLQENRTLLEAKEEQLQSRFDEVKAGVKFGMILPSSADALEVELLKVQQKYAELDYSKSGILERLSLLIGRGISRNVALKRPQVFQTPDMESKRPELMLFDLKKEQVERSTELLTKSKFPKLNAFAQGGYGNPGLNMLDNSFNTIYMAGLSLNWNVYDWNKIKTQNKSLLINLEIIDTQKEAFELNNTLELTGLQAEIDKTEELISYDEAIIPLRENMVSAADSQLKNGVITSSAFIAEFTDLYEAKNNLAMHKTQLLLKQIQYQITKGTYGDVNN